MLLENKVGLVTGAASGIGQAIALAWAREGAKVAVADIDPQGEETVALIRAEGGDAVFIRTDVGNAEEVQALVTRVVAGYGQLDIACNNAGISGPLAATADYSLEDWDKVMRVNLNGVFYGMKYQIAAMLKRHSGSIVNVASILGSVGFAGAPAYTAAKHGVVGLTRAAALDYAGRGIRINAVGPAFIHTPMIEALESDPAAHATLVHAHPMGRLGRAHEVAELVLWLSTSRASFATGAYYPIDGGYLAR